MRYKLTFATGFAAGYVLGAKAGRQRYEQIMRWARRTADSPSVQETAGVLQAQAGQFVHTAKSFVAEKATSKIGGHTTQDPTVTPYPTPTAASYGGNGSGSGDTGPIH